MTAFAEYVRSTAFNLRLSENEIVMMGAIAMRMWDDRYRYNKNGKYMPSFIGLGVLNHESVLFRLQGKGLLDQGKDEGGNITWSFTAEGRLLLPLLRVAGFIHNVPPECFKSLLGAMA